MNIVLFAWCPTSFLYLDAFARAGAVPRLVLTGPRTSAESPLGRACERLGVPLERRDDVNAPDLAARLRALSTDLLFVAGCPRILGPELLAVPRLGALNAHPSLLPAYRGKEPLFWALLHGESTVGLTLHRITADVDAGPILFQREIPVHPRATSASLAEQADRVGAALVPEVVDLARAGALPGGVLPEGPGSHCPPLRPEHGLLDFTRDAVEIDRLVRAAEGEIPAYTFFNGFRVVVVAGEPGEGEGGSATSALPGRVVARKGDALVIAAARGVYVARRFVFVGRPHDGRALASVLGIEPGSAFSASPAF